MKKKTIGIISCGREISNEGKIFLEFAKKKNVKLILINISDKFNIKSFKRKVKRCDIVYCSVWDDFSVELTKTIEEWG